VYVPDIKKFKADILEFVKFMPIGVNMQSVPFFPDTVY